MVGIAQPATSIGQRETALRWAAFVCDRDQVFAVPLAREDTPEADRGRARRQRGRACRCPKRFLDRSGTAMEVTLSLKRAKNRTRGRKRNLTGAKARVGRAYKTRADLEQQLKACRREIARTRERLAEAMKQQTATSEVMRIISSSPVRSVLDAVAENAARLCEANNAEIFRLEKNVLHLVIHTGKFR